MHFTPWHSLNPKIFQYEEQIIAGETPDAHWGQTFCLAEKSINKVNGKWSCKIPANKKSQVTRRGYRITHSLKISSHIHKLWKTWQNSFNYRWALISFQWLQINMERTTNTTLYWPKVTWTTVWPTYWSCKLTIAQIQAWPEFFLGNESPQFFLFECGTYSEIRKVSTIFKTLEFYNISFKNFSTKSISIRLIELSTISFIIFSLHTFTRSLTESHTVYGYR